MFKKFIVLVLIALILVFSVNAEEIERPKITSKSYVLYNPDNDEAVESENGNTKMYPASLTKIMTALVSYEMCDDLDEIITVSENAVKSIYGTGSSKAHILIGEEISVRQMLYLMMLPSGNDAANALAEHFCGDNESFAVQMNKKAKELGMKNSNFVNPHGLHNEDHYTTAEDLALLADAYCDIDFLCQVAETKEFIMPATNKQPERNIKTTNFMKIENSGYYYPYVKGLKTGYTDDAGHCLVATAEKNGVKYICVLLDCPEVWRGKTYVRSEFLEAAEIFDYAFETFETVKIASKGREIGKNAVFETYSKKVSLVLENDVFATLKNGTDISGLKIEYTLNNLNENNLIVPNVKKGDVIGNASIYLNGKLLGQAKVVSGNSVKAHWWLKFWHKIDLYVYITLGVIVSLIFIFFILIIRKYIILYKRQKAKQKRLERRRRLQAEFDSKPPIDYYKMD